MAHVLVVNPHITDFKLYDEWMHPLGLYFLISLLKHNHHTVSFFDCLERDSIKANGTGTFVTTIIEKPPLYHAIARHYKRYGCTDAACASYLSTIARPDYICIGTHMTYWLPGVYHTIGLIRLVFPNVPLIVGGSAATLMPQVIRQQIPSAQVFEGSLFDESRVRLSKITMLADLDYRDWVPSMIPAFDQFGTMRHGPLLTSLGCPLRCTYCASYTLAGDYQKRPIEIISAEIKCLVEKKNVRQVAVFDDAALFQAAEHLLPLLAQVRRHYPLVTINFPNGIHAGYTTAAIARALYQTGVKTIRLGYESSSRKFAHDTSHKSNRDSLAEKIGFFVEAGYQAREIGIYVMAGLEGQNAGDVLDEIDFIHSLGASPKPVFVSPIPTTALFTGYADLVPPIEYDPCYHNDTFFVTLLNGWDESTLQTIRDRAKSNR